MIGGAILSRVGGSLLSVLTLGITIQVWMILAAGVWLYFDRSSAIRQAVNSAVTELVDGAELEAAQARIEALQTINAENERIIKRDQDTIATFGDLLARAAIENEGMDDEIAELRSQPVNAACIVDDALLERVR